MRRPFLALPVALLLLSACNGAVQEQTASTGQARSAVITSSSSSAASPIGQEGLLMLGNSGAALTLTVFTNHSCEYCRQFTAQYLGRLQGDFVDPGSLRIAIVPVRLQKYPSSDFEASALFCATKQEKGLEMHRRLFSLQFHNRKSIGAVAPALGLRKDVFEACLDDPATHAFVEAQNASVAERGVTRVPSFELQGPLSVGLPEYADLRGKIEEMLQLKKE